MTHRVARVGSKGEVVIPKQLWVHLGIEPGDEVTFSLTDGAVLVEPVRERRGIKGTLRGTGLLEELEADHRDEVLRGR